MERKTFIVEKHISWFCIPRLNSAEQIISSNILGAWSLDTFFSAMFPLE